MPVGNENTAVSGGLAGRPQWRQSQRNWQHYPLQRLDRPWWKPVVRIGEAKNPGPLVCTCNSGGWSRAE
eukprot:5703642-Amphidinium_carterae.1